MTQAGPTTNSKDPRAVVRVDADASLSPALIRKLALRESGRGTERILLLHGFGCDQTVWDGVRAELNADFRCISLDLVGCGHSDRSAYDADRYAELDGYAQDVAEALLVLKPETLTIVAHSIAAMISLAALQRIGRRVRQLIMVCPTPRMIDDLNGGYHTGFSERDIDELLDLMAQNLEGWAGVVAPLAVGNEAHADSFAERLLRNDPVIAQQFAELIFRGDFRYLLRDVRDSVLVVQCTDDAFAPLDVGRYVAAQLPQGRLLTLDVTGHCPHLTNPKQLAAVIRNEALTGR